MVRAYVVFTGTGPILLVTKLDTGMQGEDATQHLANKGIKKFIAYEVSQEKAEEHYGMRFTAAVNRLASDKDLRVVDVDGHTVFARFSFAEMGEPVYVE
ncbi:MAG: hypothetical protein HQL69_11375 [Magnetococcales bacterium]|nr:hypothetical protein [Magnetococcales bacterium]